MSGPKGRMTPTRRISRLARMADGWEQLRSRMPDLGRKVLEIEQRRRLEGLRPTQNGSGTGTSKRKRRDRELRWRRLHTRLERNQTRSKSERLKRQGLVLATEIPNAGSEPVESVAQEARRRRATKRQVRLERQDLCRKRWEKAGSVTTTQRRQALARVRKATRRMVNALGPDQAEKAARYEFSDSEGEEEVVKRLTRITRLGDNAAPLP